MDSDFIYFKLNGTEAIEFKTIEHIGSKKTEKTEEKFAESYAFRYRGGDLDNFKRVLKAIMHLAKLSGAKENKQIF